MHTFVNVNAHPIVVSNLFLAFHNSQTTGSTGQKDAQGRAN